MNMCSSCNKILCGDVSDIDGTRQELCDCAMHGVDTVGEILKKSLRIVIPEDSSENSDSVEDEAINVGGLASYASSPSPGSMSHSEEWSDEGCKDGGLVLNSIGSSKSTDSTQEASYFSLPSSSTLVSAMKGSREKQGIACTKMSVSWSPDVYDPIPTIVSHTVTNRQKRYSKSDRKSGKGKHKGSKASKQSTSKDKKQSRKASGSPKNSFISTGNADDKVVTFDSHTLKFDVGSPELCASSFLKTSLMKVQLPATEAL